MARPLRPHIPGAFFHVTQRGNDRRAIFLDDQDRLSYLGVIARALDMGGERLHAYCLLTNHVHLLLQADDRPLSTFMHQVGWRHARFFNARWAHSGHLFQGRFHASHLKTDGDVLRVVRYIHLNPLRAGLVADPIGHRWSSHRAYLGDIPPPWLSTAFVRSLLGVDAEAIRLAYGQLMDVVAADAVSVDTCVSASQQCVERPDGRLDHILEEVAARTGCSVQEICGAASQHHVCGARFAVVLLARTLTRTTFGELARLLGRAPATLSNGVARRLQRPRGDWLDLIEGVRHSLSSKKEKGNA